MAEHVRRCKTLFVKNLPTSCTAETLESTFSDAGPVKRCFVVRGKDPDKPKRFGFVTYSILEDAINAKNTITSVEGKWVFVNFANPKRKPIHGNKSQMRETVEKEKTDKAPSTENITTRTLVVTGLRKDATEKEFNQLMEKLNNVQRVDFPLQGEGERAATVTFTCAKDAKQALQKLNAEVLNGTSLKVVLQSHYPTKMSVKQLKKFRLIIRNLSFKCSEEDLKKEFSRFGKIVEIILPCQPDGKKLGFGFIQFSSSTSANEALREMNTKTIRGRPIAIDWAVPKNKFEQARQEQRDLEGKNSKSDTDDGSFSENASDADDSSDKADDASNSADPYTDSSASDTESSQLPFSDEEENNENSSDEDLDDEGFSDDEEDESSDEDELPSGKKGKQKQKATTVQEKKQEKTDVHEGRTIFIRNIPFAASEDKVSELFVKYGPLNYCKLVINSKTEHSQGSAFVQFKTKASAEACMKETAEGSSDSDKLFLDGRELLVSIAVTKDNLANLKKEQANSNKDKRNLYLAREGMIRAGTKAAEGLSKSDLVKRMKVEMIKRQKLKNPMIFISPTRLCVRNIPVHVDDQQLRKMFLQQVNDKTAKITECRIMRDLNRVNSEGIAKSRGYAFVAFSEPKHALKCLRETNNNPSIYGKHKRLIVEFSLENKSAIQTKEKRRERMQVRQRITKDPKENKQKTKPAKSKEKVSLAREGVNNSGKVKKGLPSHWGPKIRHKNTAPRKSAKKTKKRMTSRSEGKPTHSTMNKKRKKREYEDSFDRLVDNYKKKFMAMTS